MSAEKWCTGLCVSSVSRQQTKIEKGIVLCRLSRLNEKTWKKSWKSEPNNVKTSNICHRPMWTCVMCVTYKQRMRMRQKRTRIIKYKSIEMLATHDFIFSRFVYLFISFVYFLHSSCVRTTYSISFLWAIKCSFFDLIVSLSCIFNNEMTLFTVEMNWILVRCKMKILLKCDYNWFEEIHFRYF